MDTKEEVLENLIFVDQFIKKEFPQMDKLELVLVGGASFLLKGLKTNYTLDIDTISHLDEEVKSFLESFTINDAALEVVTVSPSYKERLVRFEAGFNVLDIYLLSDEDLIITKLGRSDKKDLDTLMSSGIMKGLNIALLEELANEVAAKDASFARKWEYFKRTNLYWG